MMPLKVLLKALEPPAWESFLLAIPWAPCQFITVPRVRVRQINKACKNRILLSNISQNIAIMEIIRQGGGRRDWVDAVLACVDATCSYFSLEPFRTPEPRSPNALVRIKTGCTLSRVLAF